MHNWWAFVCIITFFFFPHESHYKQPSSLRNECKITHLGHILYISNLLFSLNIKL